MVDFFGRLLGFFLKLVLFLGALVFMLSLFFVALVLMLVISLWTAVTGRRPQPTVVFGRVFSRARTPRWGPQPGAHRAPADDGQVIDAEVKEVPDQGPKKR